MVLFEKDHFLRISNAVIKSVALDLSEDFFCAHFWHKTHQHRLADLALVLEEQLVELKS